jgi:putative flippase GtrA
VRRIVHFVLIGLLSTAVSYLVFIALIRLGLHYALASVASWAAGLAVGFVLNRRFTFGITGPERRTRDFGLYVIGALLQLLLGLTGYAITIGRLGLNPTLAFAINLPITTAFSFLFLRFVTFRRAAQPQPSGAAKQTDD